MSKLDIATSKLYDDFDRDEAINRLPEIEDIKDDTLREMTIDAIQSAPSYFWTAPAASKHHPPEHRQRHGLWLATKRSATCFERVTQSMVKQGHLTWEEVDMGRAACLLKDIYKYGMPPTSVDSTVASHDVIAAEWLDQHTQLPDEVIGAVEAHNGAYYEGKTPQSHLEQMVHIADMYSSDQNARIAVKNPHIILREQFPRVSER